MSSQPARRDTNTPRYMSLCSAPNLLYVIHADQRVVGIRIQSGHATVVPTPYSDAVAVAASSDSVLVLHTDGRLSTFPHNAATSTAPIVDIPNDIGRVVEIGASNTSYYARSQDGVLTGWGRDGAEHIADLGYIDDCASLHPCRHHLLVHTDSGMILHTGSHADNDADTYPLLREGIKKLHAADIRAVAITTDHRVVDVYDANIGIIAQDPSIVDVVATRSLYGLLYTNGRVVVLNRYTFIEDDDPLYVDPVTLHGVSTLYANGDTLACVGFDGRIWAVRSDEQFGFDPQPVALPDDLRAMVWPGLSTQPEDYNADACHEANTLALRLGAIKQTHAYMNAPHKPTF